MVLSLDYLELALNRIQYLLELFLVNLRWLLWWMGLLYVVGFGLKLGHLLLALCFWIISVMFMNWFNNGGIMETKVSFLGGGGKMWLKWWEKISGNSCKIHQHYYHRIGSRKVRRTLEKAFTDMGTGLDHGIFVDLFRHDLSSH